MTKADKLAAVIAVGVFILSRIFLSWFDSLTMRCAVSVCGADHLPLVGGLIGAAVFLIGYASLRGAK